MSDFVSICQYCSNCQNEMSFRLLNSSPWLLIHTIYGNQTEFICFDEISNSICLYDKEFELLCCTIHNINKKDINCSHCREI